MTSQWAFAAGRSGWGPRPTGDGRGLVLVSSRGDGRYARLLKALGRVDLLILGDWGLTPLAAAERRDLLEILEGRHGRKATIVTSQPPVESWHDAIGEPTLS